MKRAGALLLSPPFLIALSLLAINDALLKSRFPGFVTGKLSDVAGLFAFVVFICALIPRRCVAIGIVVAIAFTWWKSPLSKFAIDGWNRIGSFAIGRTIDFTDLVALAIIPIALAWIARREEVAHAEPRRVMTFAIGAMSLVAFTATSVARRECCAAAYEVPMNRVATVAALTNVARDVTCESDSDCSFSFRSKEICGDNGSADVNVWLTANGDRTRIRVINITYWCKGDHDLTAQRAFEELVIRKLGGQRVSQ
jgi:hypothetical protein